MPEPSKYSIQQSTRTEILLLNSIVFLISCFLFVLFSMIQYLLPLKTLPFVSVFHGISLSVIVFLIEKRVTVLMVAVALFPLIITSFLPLIQITPLTVTDRISACFGLLLGISISAGLIWLQNNRKEKNYHRQQMQR